MKDKRISLKMIVMISTLFVLIVAVVDRGQAQDGIYGLDFIDIYNAKGVFDDPSPIFEELSYKKIMPKEYYEMLTFDVEEMKTLWADVIGFKAPDVVGKRAPEIVPGTYEYSKDKEKYPFKELMIPLMYEQFAPGGPPFVGNFPEITVIPTQQYFWAKPIAEASKKNIGTVKQDDKGYMLYETYDAGLPFPRPSGKFAANQMMHNWEKRYARGESYYIFVGAQGFNRHLENDYDSIMEMYNLRLDGRVLIEPLGWFDDRAEKHREARCIINKAYSPRDMYGNVFYNLAYEDPNRHHLSMMYLNAFRRVRSMTGTDTQDPAGGQDVIYDDGDGFNQKLSPSIYPYTYEVIEEREYLMPSYTLDGSGCLSLKDHAFHGFEWQRRPVMVLLKAV